MTIILEAAAAATGSCRSKQTPDFLVILELNPGR